MRKVLRRIADMTAAGTQVIALLTLSDDGAPGDVQGRDPAPVRRGQQWRT